MSETENRIGSGDQDPFPTDIAGEATIFLILYINGASAMGARAVERLKRILREGGVTNYRLEVVDVDASPEALETESILVIPTLVKRAPDPPARLVGDVSDKARILDALALRDAS